MLKRPINFWRPLPFSSVSISPWYQASPKGALGSWITKKSNSVRGGNPLTSTRISSTGPFDLIFTCPLTSDKQWPFSAAAERTRSKVRVFSSAPARWTMSVTPRVTIRVISQDVFIVCSFLLWLTPTFFCVEDSYAHHRGQVSRETSSGDTCPLRVVVEDCAAEVPH